MCRRVARRIRPTRLPRADRFHVRLAFDLRDARPPRRYARLLYLQKVAHHVGERADNIDGRRLAAVRLDVMVTVVRLERGHLRVAHTCVEHRIRAGHFVIDRSVDFQAHKIRGPQRTSLLSNPAE